MTDHITPPEGTVILGYGGTFKVPGKSKQKIRCWAFNPEIGQKWMEGWWWLDDPEYLFAAPADSEVVWLNSDSGDPGQPPIRTKQMGAVAIAGDGERSAIGKTEDDARQAVEEMRQPPSGQETATPRTDAAEYTCHIPTILNNSRTLERELTAAREEITGLIGLHDESCKHNASLRRDVADLESRNKHQQDTIRKMRTTVSFFSSVIKSGEPWTATCQSALEAALALADGKGGTDG